MKAYKLNTPNKNLIKQRNVQEGETIEQKVMRMMRTNEPITDHAQIIYTTRKDGVLPIYNIRSDRFEMALDMADELTKRNIAKRTEGQAKVLEMKEGKKPVSTNDQQNQNAAPEVAK